MKMLVSKISNNSGFLVVLRAFMNYLRRNQSELDFNSSNSAQRWERVKEYVRYVEDDYLHKDSKHLKQILQSYTPGYTKISPSQKSLFYAQIKAKFLAEIPEYAQKPMSSQKSEISKSQIKPFKRLKEMIIFTNLH